MRQRFLIGSRTATGSRMRQGADVPLDVYRLIALDRNGENRVQIFEQQENRLAADFASTLLVDRLANNPTDILVSAYGQNGLALWRANVTDGRVEKLDQGSWNTVRYIADGAGTAVLREDEFANNSGYRILRRPPGGRGWEVITEVRRGARSNSPDFVPMGSGPGAGQVYVLARPEGRDLAAIYLYDAATGAYGNPIYEHQGSDDLSLWLNPRTRAALFGCAFAQTFTCQAMNPSDQRHYRALSGFFGPGETVDLLGMSDDGNVWLLSSQGPQNPGGVFIYDRTEARIEAMFVAAPQLEGASFGATRTVSYQSTDGRTIWGYLTMPSGASGPVPLVVHPHGGPELRDYFGFDPHVQFLVSRGYAVFQPQFRGSSGFGREFAFAGRGQWGRLMQDDITAGVRYLASEGVIDPERVCILGASYGGYAALAGAAMTPDVYKCAISIAGISDLNEMLRAERADEGRASSIYAYWVSQVGEPGDGLQANSPRYLADRVTIPVLLMHGDADRVVLVNQSELMRDGLQAAGKTVRYVPFEGAGHSWSSWSKEQLETQLREIEQWLAQSIGTPP